VVGIVLALLITLGVAGGAGYIFRKHLRGEMNSGKFRRQWRSIVRNNRPLREHMIKVSQHYD
jgi:hypothetical protein